MSDLFESAEVPPHHLRHGFRNPWLNSAPAGPLAIARWMLGRIALRLTRGRDRATFSRAASAFAYPRAHPDRLTVTWIGHSTVLVQAGGRNILTDPVWSRRASPLQWIGPARWVEPGIALDALPPIDLVLISHNHYDHLDAATVRALAARHPDARWAAPLGLAKWLRARGARDVVELDWWAEARLGGGEATVVAVPAQHFSARGVHDRQRTLWCGWAVEAGQHRVLFCGDSGHHPEWREIGERRGPFDVALVPVGAYEPRWFMRAVHMNPEEAVAAYQELSAAGHRSIATGIISPPRAPPVSEDVAARHRTVMVPIHWGTFKLTDEPMAEPPARTRAEWRRAGLPDEDLWLLAHGETRGL
ncbi:MAG: MBL fold metallo-hydrolase [Gemmatimonadota bacterium]|nr:MBL fold metallo-hydrolase [Gemmatimonadota bacterium]